MERYDDLYKKIIGRLNSSRIQNNREVVSAKFVEDSVRYTMEQYNNALIKNQAETIKLMNKSLGYTFLTSKSTKKGIARVVNIINKVTEDGNVYSVVVLEDGTFIMNSYGHWDKDYSLSWGGGVTTDRCYIKQAKFKLGEFENDNNWDRIEEFCKRASGHDEVWYATNIEIYDYVEAYNSLQFSMNGNMVKNPSCQTLWFDSDGILVKVMPGETVKYK